MRTAEEILKTFELGIHIYGESARRDILYAINEARKEAIEECAERAKSGWIRYGVNMGHAVEKESILSLIQELK